MNSSKNFLGTAQSKAHVYLQEIEHWKDFLFSAFYFKQGLSQMWKSTLKYYKIHLNIQYKVPVKTVWLTNITK